jgi:phosphohistidine phosphatase
MNLEIRKKKWNDSNPTLCWLKKEDRSTNQTQLCMKTLYLLRHAKAPRHVPGVPDLGRPLKVKGVQQALSMAGQVASLLPAPGVVCCSPSLRTRQSLLPFLEVWGIAPDAVSYDEKLYLATAKKLSAVVQALPAGTEIALLVGHNPGLTQVANWLGPQEHPIDELPPGGFLQLDFLCESWSEVRRGTGVIKLNLRPSQLEE